MSKKQADFKPKFANDFRDFRTAEIATGTAAGSVHRREYRDCLPIDRYWSQGLISGRQYAAGVRLAELHHHAGLGPRVTADLLAVGGGSGNPYGMAVSEKQADARKSLRMALEAIPAYVRPVVLQVIVDGFSGAKIDIGRPLARQASTLIALDRLTQGLEALADHWGYPPTK